MTALLEKAAWTSLAPYLGEGESTVGTKREITHDSASPLGHERFIITNDRFLAKAGRKLEG